MPKTSKTRCPNCGFLDTIKWGIRSGHQRYKCQNCNTLFTPRRKDVSMRNRFVWFKWWIIHKQTISEISKLSGYSTRQLHRWFNEYLENYPRWEIQRRKSVNLLIDGTWFPNQMCLVVYRDETIKRTIFYRVTDNEWEDELVEDLLNLISLGIKIESITSDGGRNIIRAAKKACPDAIRQRCLAHIQRECLIWLTQHPKSEAGTGLRRLVRRISAIKTNNDRLAWLQELNLWYDTYKEYINAKSFKEESHAEWYTHKMVRKAYTHIKKALPDMFHFLENPSIPKTTNALESFFGHLKENITLHRGMSKVHYQNYVKWYLYFRKKENSE